MKCNLYRFDQPILQNIIVLKLRTTITIKRIFRMFFNELKIKKKQKKNL